MPREPELELARRGKRQPGTLPPREPPDVWEAGRLERFRETRPEKPPQSYILRGGLGYDSNKRMGEQEKRP